MPEEALYFDFYGILVKVVSNDKKAISFIESDFSYFRVNDPGQKKVPNLTVSVNLGKPPFERIPTGSLAYYHTKDAVVYKNGHIKYFDSFGKTLVIYDSRRESAEIFTLNRDGMYEKCYLMIMSRIGEMLDRKKLHRIHAMGVVFEGKAVLCLLPMGGGKTTLALSLLENKEFSLLSEEVPLVSEKGILYPFPIRLGVIEGTQLSIPEEYLRPFKRPQYLPKTLIDSQYFKNQIASVAEPGFIFIGKRVHSAHPKIIKTSFFRTLMSLFRLCVIGIGLPQMLEYILRFDFFDIARQFPIFLSRLRASIILIYKSKTYELHLSYDLRANADLLTDFITNELSMEPSRKQ
jgi:hypothetical protein